MNNYKKLQHFVDLCPKGATIERLSHNTCKRETEDKEGILYEYTHIVIKDKTNDDIKLNTDGRYTESTKRKMNEYLSDYRINVFQKNKNRFVTFGEYQCSPITIDYYDNMTI